MATREGESTAVPDLIVFPEVVLPPLEKLPTEALESELKKFGFPESFSANNDYEQILNFFRKSTKKEGERFSGNEMLFFQSMRVIFGSDDTNIKRYENWAYPGKTEEEMKEIRKARDLNTASYLAQNLSSIDQLVRYTHDGLFFKGKLWEAMLTGDIPATKSDADYVIARHIPCEISETGIKNISLLAPEAAARVISDTSVGVIEKAGFLTERTRKFLLFCKDFANLSDNRQFLSYLFANKEKWPDFFDDEMNVTGRLLDDLVNQDFFQEGKVSFLEYEWGFLSNLRKKIKIDSFPESERKVWEKIFSCPGPLLVFSIRNRELIAPDGNPTLAFFDRALESYKTDDLGYLKLLSEDTIAAFPESENKNYWRFLTILHSQKMEGLAKVFIALGKDSIRSQDDINFFKAIIDSGLGGVDKDADGEIGSYILKLFTRQQKASFADFSRSLTDSQYAVVRDHLKDWVTEGINDGNWQMFLVSYLMEFNDYLSNVPQEVRDGLLNLFKDPGVRDFCLGKFSEQWVGYLKSGDKEKMPFTLMLMSGWFAGGVGPLSQVEFLANFVRSVRNSYFKETTAEVTKQRIFEGLGVMEERFVTEKWSDDDRVNFYSISSDILNTAPSLYTDFLQLFQGLSQKELKAFIREIYPFYRVKMSLLEMNEKNLLDLRKDIRTIDKTNFVQKKGELSESIKQDFKEKLGVIKVPEEFSSEDFKTVVNFCLYLSNLHGRDQEKEVILGFFLALSINGKWQAFRKGEVIDPAVYLTPEKSSLIRQLLQKRKEVGVLTGERLGLTEEELPVFQQLLQEEEEAVLTGNIETIDVKLNNFVRNLEELTDPDLYSQKIDGQMLKLVLESGNKEVGRVAAKLYQELSGRQIEFSQEEEALKEKIAQVLKDNGLEVTPSNVNEYFQKRMRGLSAVGGLLGAVKEARVMEEIANLKIMMEPSVELIKIFGRLGEDFGNESGAVALYSDLDYLENLASNKKGELAEPERIAVATYLDAVRNQVTKLQSVFDQLGTRVDALRVAGSSDNPLLAAKIEEISKIMKSGDTQVVITGRITNNMSTVVENIRECLACVRSGINNDTNLTFGDGNKFYLVSFAEGKKGSVADELAFVLPTTDEKEKGLVFVLDKVYGHRTPDILKAHVAVVCKKYAEIKKQFPHIKLSVFVSDSALSISENMEGQLRQYLEESYEGVVLERTNIELYLPRSPFGDNYIEFGLGVRQAGKKTAGGVMIRLQ